MIEIWNIIEGHNGRYEVSNLGNVKSNDISITRSYGKIVRFKGKMLNLTDNGNGYLRIRLQSETNEKAYYVHQLVAKAFIENVNFKNNINHKDGNKKNNNVSNLEWVTHKENNIHAVATGLTTGTKLDEHKVRDIRIKYKTGKYTQRQLANEFSVSQRLILFVLKGGAWSHVV